MTHEHDPVVVPLDDIRAQVKQWRTAQYRMRHWKAVAVDAQRVILAHLRAVDGDVGTVSGRRAVVLTLEDRRRLDAARLRRDHPELADEYTFTTEEYRLNLPDTVDGAA